MTTLRWGDATDVGNVRANNQDHILTSDDLFAVADGMGGHVGGEVASDVAVTALKRAFSGTPHTPDQLLDAVREANTAVFERSMADDSLRGMGTTVTVAALVEVEGEERVAIANVGDSRTYVFAQNELTQLTEDHSIPEELVRRGQLDPAEVDTHPQRHILTRALGIQPDVEIDLWEVLPVAGDRVLLCSDGLVREVTDDQIAAVLRRLADPGDAAKELVARARAHGGADNISVVVVDVVDDGGLVQAATDATRNSAAPAPAGVVEHDAPPAETDASRFTRVTPVEEHDEPPPAQPPRRRRRFTLRLALFILLLLVIIGGAGAAVTIYARGSYYVAYGAPAPGAPVTPGDGTTPAGLGPRPIIVYQGRPGGLLWFDPTIAERSPHTSADVCPSHAQDLINGHVVSSKRAADAYIDNLVSEAQQTCVAK